jgi:hypothetical protein
MWPGAFYGVHVNDMTRQLQQKIARVLRVRNTMAIMEQSLRSCATGVQYES